MAITVVVVVVVAEFRIICNTISKGNDIDSVLITERGDKDMPSRTVITSVLTLMRCRSVRASVHERGRKSGEEKRQIGNIWQYLYSTSVNVSVEAIGRVLMSQWST